MEISLSQSELDLLKRALVSWTDGFSGLEDEECFDLFTKLGGDMDFIFQILGS